MDSDDNRARGDRSLSEPGGSSFGHVQLSDAPRVCEAKAVGTGLKFRHRIGGTAATDDRPHEPREQGQMASGAVAPAELDLRLGLSEGAMTFLLSSCASIVLNGLEWIVLTAAVLGSLSLQRPGHRSPLFSECGGEPWPRSQQ